MLAHLILKTNCIHTKDKNNGFKKNIQYYRVFQQAVTANKLWYKLFRSWDYLIPTKYH